jgi:hypothetical protein
LDGVTDGHYDSIREALPITGKSVVDVTCDDWSDVCAEFPEPADRITHVYVHFSDGSTLSFLTSEAIGFSYDDYPDGEEHAA